MDFYAMLDQVVALLRQRQRVTYRALKRHFQLDDSVLEDLTVELIKGQRLAVDEDGDVLVWIGDAAVAPSPAAAPVPAPTPLGYTPPHLAEKILTARRALEGERKQVTVLFADLKGSTELIRDLGPEQAQAILDPALHAMMEAVHRYEGTVNQVLGDGIMALFGAPLAHEDHAARACYAALAMQDALRRYADEVRRTHGLPVQMRVGLHSGDVVVRTIANDLHMDYSAVGLTTVLAARMEQLATPGSMLLTAATLRLVEGYVEVMPLGPVPVKGLQEPVEVYELLRAGPVRSRLQAAVARGLTRFVGRDAELEQLRQALARAGAGQGQVVATLICGDGYFAAYEDAVVEQVRVHWRTLQPDVFIAGPAFRAGRYGLACGRLCLEAERLNIPAVTGMHIENPGSDLYRPEHLYIIATETSAVGMRPALARMAALAIKRARRQPLGTAADEGFLPRAVRRTISTGTPAAVRAVDMALRKWRGEPYTSELTVETFEAIPPAPAVTDPSQMLLALVTESGVVRKGNPDRLPAAAATHWASYSVAGMDRLVPGEWDAVHGGYDNTAALQDPNRVVPLDALRELERQGVIGQLLDDMFVTVGNIGSLNAMKRIGAEIADRLVQRGVQAVVLPAT